MASPSLLSFDSLIIETPPVEEKQPLHKRIFKFISTSWTEAPREALKDSQSIRWGRAGRWTLFALWAMTLLGIFSFLILYGALSSSFEDGDTACRSDGSFDMFLSEYNAWKASGFFEINLGFGSLTFTQAKIIDISWDMIIGRGGQTLMAIVSWRVFADYTTTSMALEPIPYAAFFMVFLQDEPSIFSIFHLLRIFISGYGLKSRVAMFFMILSMLFLLGWPTLASAMTGYTTISAAFVPDYNDNYIPFSSFKPIAYIVHDGWRVNLGGEYAVSLFDSKKSAVEPVIYPPPGNFFHGPERLCRMKPQDVDSSCYIQNSTSTYVSSYGFFGLQNTTSVWMNTTLPSPVLNISVFYPVYGILDVTDESDPLEAMKNQPLADPSNMAFTYFNQTYTLNYIKNKGSCQPVQDRFKWGFSFIQALILVTLLVIWTFGTYTMWLKARLQLPLQGQAEVPKGWRSVLILAETVSKQLKEAGIDPHSLTDRKLKGEIKKHLRGGSVSFDIPLTRSGYKFRHGIRCWLKRERRWCSSLLLIIVLLLGVMFGSIPGRIIPLGFFFFFAGFLPFISCGIIFAMAVGSTRKSRLFMTGCWCVFGLIIGLVLAR